MSNTCVYVNMHHQSAHRDKLTGVDVVKQSPAQHVQLVVRWLPEMYLENAYVADLPRKVLIWTRFQLWAYPEFPGLFRSKVLQLILGLMPVSRQRTTT